MPRVIQGQLVWFATWTPTWEHDSPERLHVYSRVVAQAGPLRAKVGNTFYMYSEQQDCYRPALYHTPEEAIAAFETRLVRDIEILRGKLADNEEILTRFKSPDGVFIATPKEKKP